MDVQENLTGESGNKVNAYFNPNTNTILFDANAIDNQGYQLLGHEVFGHGILENFNTNPKFKDIIYKEIQNDNDFVNKYKNKILQEYQTTENSDLYKSELISHYIQENVIENNDINKLELLANNRGFIRELFNNLKLILNNTTSNRVIREVRKAVRNFAKNNYRLSSVLLKIADNKPLSRKEQEYYNDNKTLIDTYFDIVNGTNEVQTEPAYSRELSNEEKENIAEETYDSLEKFNSNDLKNLKNNYGYALESFEAVKNYVNDAINGDTTPRFGLIGKISDRLAKRIQSEVNINVKGYSLAYYKNSLEHINERHIKNNAHSIKLNLEDLYLFPYLLENAYSINKSIVRGEIRIDFKTNLGNEILTVTTVSSKNGRVYLQNMYVIKKVSVFL